MTHSNKDTPSIRFAGFTDAWEQRKLGDFGKATAGTSIESEFSEDGKYKVISIGSYSENSVYRDQGIRAIESEKTKNRVLNKEDLTMILNDKTSSGNIIGRVLLIEESGVYVYNQRTERIEIDHNKFDSLFIYEMLNAPQIRDKIVKQSQGNTQIYVNWPTIAETDYLVPRIDEQRCLGEFFSNLNYLITLHQRKCDALQKFKKSMLQKMFPKDGESVPEIRFAGFTDAWKQRKLGNTLDYLSNNTLSRAELSDKEGTYRNVHYGDVLIKFGEYIDAQNTDLPHIADDTKAKKFETSKLQDGDIVIADTAEDEAVGKCVEIGNIGDLSIVSGLHTIPCRPKVKYAPAYLGFYLNSGAYHDQLIPLMQGIKVTSISKSALSDTIISAPKDLGEQKAIGQFFIHLDTLITLHQRKLETLQKMKKSLLQKMFV